MTVDASKMVEIAAQRVRKRRKQLDLSQKDLANASGMHLSSINKIENGEISPSLDSLVNISNALSVPLCTLLVEEGVYVMDMKDIKEKYKTKDELPEEVYLFIIKILDYAKSLGI